MKKRNAMKALLTLATASFLVALPSCTEGAHVVGASKAPRPAQQSSNWESDVDELNQKIIILKRWQQG